MARVSDWLRSLRRRVHHRVKKHPRYEDEASEEALKNMAAGTRQAAEELKAVLSVDESGFRYVATQAHSNARDYFLFDCLDEIEKAMLVVFEVLDQVSGPELDPKEAFTRIAAEQGHDEVALWRRKLIEA